MVLHLLKTVICLWYLLLLKFTIFYLLLKNFFLVMQVWVNGWVFYIPWINLNKIIEEELWVFFIKCFYRWQLKHFTKYSHWPKTACLSWKAVIPSSFTGWAIVFSGQQSQQIILCRHYFDHTFPQDISISTFLF